MPIYEYEREDGTVFEFIQKINDQALVSCPTTGQPVKRKMSASMPIFKGSGFYKTDYCSNSSSSKSQSSASSSSSSSDSSSNKSDNKTESKPKSCGSGCGCH